MAFCWRADDGPLIVVFGYAHQLKKLPKKPTVKAGPPLSKLSGSGHMCENSHAIETHVVAEATTFSNTQCSYLCNVVTYVQLVLEGI